LQEFFYLTALAVKMTHALGEDTLSVPTEELWLKAIDESIPFHRFHNWIENELTKRYLADQLIGRLEGERPNNLRTHRREVLACTFNTPPSFCSCFTLVTMFWFAFALFPHV